MKYLFLILFSFVLFSSSVQAKEVFDETQSFQIARAIKIGRSGAILSTSSDSLGSSSSNGGIVDFVSPCDENCETCDYRSGLCKSCAVYYYATPNSPNCTRICDNVTCIAGATKKEYATYCACE